MTDEHERLSVSWSRLKAYEQCHQRVFRRLEGKSSKAVDGRIFLPGTVADRAMRAYLELDDPQVGHITDPVDEILEKHAFHDDQYVVKWRGKPQEDLARVKAVVLKVLTNLEPILWREIIPHGYQAEVRFDKTIGVPYLDGRVVGVDLRGGIDILTATLNAAGQDDEGSEYGVWDLKATQDNSYVRGSILGQLTFYSIAVKAMFGKYPTQAAFITPACKQQIVPVRIGEDEIRAMMSRIIRYCEGVWREEWEPKEERDSECTYCDVKHACDLFRLPPGTKVSFGEMARLRKAARDKK